MASSDSQVSFGFQTDVVSTASLAHLLTGRILKALSDGGIDLYAVTASIWLSKQMPFRSSLQNSVHTTLAARTGTNGFLAKALSIGWGHTSIAVEMARTKAGTNALLLIGAAVAGVPRFHAAQCLSELLTIYGCAADQTPSVDVLKNMAAYIGPMVQDLGFDRVLEHVTTSAAHAMTRLDKRIPVDLTGVGTPQAFASAVKQLVFTSERRETLYLIPRQRGAWLAAFASHLLGMSVDLVYGENVLWASGGDEGNLTLQMAPESGPETALMSRTRTGDFMLEPPAVEDLWPVDTEYLIPDALEGELGRIRGMDPHLRQKIHRAIAQLSTNYMDQNHSRWYKNYTPNGALSEALQRLQVEHDAIPGAEHMTLNLKTFEKKPGYRYLDFDLVNAIQCPHENPHLRARRGDSGNIADDHEDRPWSESPERCMCIKVEQLIGRFSMIAYCLARCRLDAATTRISRKGIRMISHYDDQDMMDFRDPPSLFTTLGLLFLNVDYAVISSTIKEKAESEEYILGVSGGTSTVFYTSLLQDDCFDDFGRVITIAPGRASIEGALRSVILEGSLWEKDLLGSGRVDRLGMTTELAPGATITPHYRPGPIQIVMSASLAESHIVVETSSRLDNGLDRKFFLSRALGRFTRSYLSPPCGHARDQGFETCPADDGIYRISPFSPHRSRENEGYGTWIYALKGHKLEQVLQHYVPNEFCELQVFVCLRCAIRIAKENDIRSIIMGG